MDLGDKKVEVLKGLCHTILVFFKKPKYVLPSTEFQKYCSRLVIQDYIMTFILLPVFCCYEWQGWKWLESFDLNLEHQKTYYRLPFFKIFHYIFTLQVI